MLTSEKMSKEMRDLIIKMAVETKSSHVGPSYSIADILAVLYCNILRIDPKHPAQPGRDRFILSKGHAASALYAVLCLCGFFSQRKLDGYLVDGGKLHGHPSLGTVPGIEFSSGSLGHGLAVGSGMLLGMSKTYPKARVYVLMGNGECDEGSVWEAAAYIGRVAQKNISVIIDDNGFQGYRVVVSHQLSLEDRWRSFGWNVTTVDGHSHRALRRSFTEAGAAGGPTAIIAKTISGKGILGIENTLEAHYWVPKEKISVA